MADKEPEKHSRKRVFLFTGLDYWTDLYMNSKLLTC